MIARTLGPLSVVFIIELGWFLYVEHIVRYESFVTTEHMSFYRSHLTTSLFKYPRACEREVALL
jgi:hypothetical protein